MADFWKWFDAEVSKVPAPLAERFAAAGFKAFPNGGNCLAWAQEFKGGVVLITNEDLSLIGSETDPDWAVGVHLDDGAFLTAGDSRTLDVCFHTASTLPRDQADWKRWCAEHPEYLCA